MLGLLLVQAFTHFLLDKRIRLLLSHGQHSYPLLPPKTHCSHCCHDPGVTGNKTETRDVKEPAPNHTGSEQRNQDAHSQDSLALMPLDII